MFWFWAPTRIQAIFFSSYSQGLAGALNIVAALLRTSIFHFLEALLLQVGGRGGHTPKRVQHCWPQEFGFDICFSWTLFPISSPHEEKTWLQTFMMNADSKSAGSTATCRATSSRFRQSVSNAKTHASLANRQDKLGYALSGANMQQVLVARSTSRNSGRK